MMKKILFLHGFFASGTCALALTLKEYFQDKASILTPDLPLHPQEALSYIRQICTSEHPDILVGNSNGAFLAQIIASEIGIPALLGNPHLGMNAFLAERIGTHQYKSPRADGNQQVVIDQQLIDEFSLTQQHQWDSYRPENKQRIWGLFGETDQVAHFEPLFSKYYTNTFHFPGGHIPTDEEVRKYYAPLIERLLEI